jgi:N-acetylglucosamine-6-phosphate deacetylase
MVAVLQSSINPARALGLPNPTLQRGARADLVVLDDQLGVSAVLSAGAWVDELVSGA